MPMKKLIANCSSSLYARKMWQRRQDIIFEKKLGNRGQNTIIYSNLLEVLLKLFKDVVLQRCKTFNAISLIDLTVYRWKFSTKKNDCLKLPPGITNCQLIF